MESDHYDGVEQDAERAERDDAEESWINTGKIKKREVTPTIMGHFSKIRKMTDELEEMIKNSYPIRKVFENEAVEDLEIQAMKEAEIKKY